MSETTNDTQACTQVTSVQEVRPGLFRMHWIFDHSRMKEGCHKKDFYLSLPDQFYTITYHLKYSDIKLKPYRYSVTVEASSTHGEYSDEEQTSFETNSSIHSQPSQSQSNDLLELDITFCPKWQEFHAPVYMWINTDRSSTHGNKVPLLKENLWPVAVSTLVPKAAWSSNRLGRFRDWLRHWKEQSERHE